MRAKVGMLTAGLIASVLAVGSPVSGQESSTTEPTTTGDTSTTVEPSTTAEAPTTVAETTTIAEPPAAQPESTTTAEPTTTPAQAPASSAETTSTLAVELGSVGPASPGRITPERGPQETTKPLPPPPPTTTTTTVPPDWVLPANSGTGRRAVYSKSLQRVWAVNSEGEVIKTHLVSGRQTPLDPRPGTYSVWSRSRHTHSIQNPTIRWGYMVRFAKGGRGGNIGFHEIPFQYGRPVQTIAQLGQPLSGGCVRQAKPDAIWMWNWAGLGTKVVVLP